MLIQLLEPSCPLRLFRYEPPMGGALLEGSNSSIPSRGLLDFHMTALMDHKEAKETSAKIRKIIKIKISKFLVAISGKS